MRANNSLIKKPLWSEFGCVSARLKCLASVDHVKRSPIPKRKRRWDLLHAFPVPILLAVRPFDGGPAIAVAFVVAVPFLTAVRQFDSGTILTVAFAVTVPMLFAVIIPFNGGTIFTMESTIAEPYLMAVHPFDSRTVLAMEFAFAIPILIAVLTFDSRAIVAMKFAFAIPILIAVLAFDSRAIRSMKLAATDVAGTHAGRYLDKLVFRGGARRMTTKYSGKQIAYQKTSLVRIME